MVTWGVYGQELSESSGKNDVLHGRVKVRDFRGACEVEVGRRRMWAIFFLKVEGDEGVFG